MSDTPRTDEYEGCCAECHRVNGMTLIQHARQLERENAELHKQRQRDALLGSAAMQADHELITKLRKDKKRLDWLMENDCLRDWIANGVAYGLNEGREYIDAAMEESQ